MPRYPVCAASGKTSTRNGITTRENRLAPAAVLNTGNGPCTEGYSLFRYGLPLSIAREEKSLIVRETEVICGPCTCE